ncbi:MAG: purine-nucleoside phosphorylase [Eubacteriaceae bacterium]|nr:purine-nucleoside phosphorylase [Eubacteriaceae bacterium]
MFTESAEYIKKYINIEPEIGIILGSGLGGIADVIENPVMINYKDIPNFKTSTAPDHLGRFVIGRLAGKNVICMQGRLHYYEGYSLEDVVYPVRVMKLLGVKTLIATNAAGGINESFNSGDIMLIKDHINFMGNNPLIGKNYDELGPRFQDMTYAYTPKLIYLAEQCAEKMSINLKSGVYIAFSGPSFETPAEIRTSRILGADAVGMSTVPEVIAAAHCGMQVLAFSLIANMAAGVTDKALDGEEVIRIAQEKGKILQQLIIEILNNYN